MIDFLSVVLFPYLVGSFNFAYLVSQINNTDIRNEGSGNPGSANVLRTLGKKAAIFVLIADILKGFLVPYFVSLINPTYEIYFGVELIVFSGFFVVLGHCFPIYYKFKGGKGVATFVGFIVYLIFLHYFLNLYWLVFLIGTYLLVLKITKVSALASLTIVVISCFMFYQYLIEVSFNNFLFYLLLVFLIIGKHSDNFNRMLKGDENKF